MSKPSEIQVNLTGKVSSVNPEERVLALDGIRGFAITLVIVGHLSGRILPYASVIGVSVFFVLSGYLITGLLIKELQETGSLRLRTFYARRALRLAPALVVMLLVTMIATLFMKYSHPRDYLFGSALALSYTTNIAVTHGFDLPALKHTWSLAMEEQFYLLLPVILMVNGRHSAHTKSLRSIRKTLFLITLVALIWRIWAQIAWSPERVYFGPDTACFALLAGATLAGSKGVNVVLARISPIVVLILVFIGVGSNHGSHSGSISTANWIVMAASVACMPLVGSAARNGSVLFSNRLMVWLGGISYGWYLWHVPVIMMWENGREATGIQRIYAILVSLVLAVLSKKLIETPAQRWGRRRLNQVLTQPSLAVVQERGDS